MWPFGGRRAGKTVAEQRAGNLSAEVKIANEISRLHNRVLWLERNAPYEKNDRRRKNMDIEKLRNEEKIKSLDKKREGLANRNKG